MQNPERQVSEPRHWSESVHEPQLPSGGHPRVLPQSRGSVQEVQTSSTHPSPASQSQGPAGQAPPSDSKAHFGASPQVRSGSGPGVGVSSSPPGEKGSGRGPPQPIKTQTVNSASRRRGSNAVSLRAMESFRPE